MDLLYKALADLNPYPPWLLPREGYLCALAYNEINFFRYPHFVRFLFHKQFKYIKYITVAA